MRFALSLALLTAGTAHAGPAAASPTLTSLRVAEYQDFVLARAKPLSEGSIPADTIIFICNPDEWREVMGDVPPPDWPNDPMMLLVGPLNHEFSCANIELRPKSDSNNVSLRQPTTSAPSAPGGCAISVQRTVRGEPIVVMGAWYWEHQLATIRSCGERVSIPHTDNADFLRVQVKALDTITSKSYDLTDAKVLLSGYPVRTRSALIGRDGVAILQDIPAWIRYDIVVQPRGCGEFRFPNQSISPGHVASLELDLGLLASLNVQVSREEGARHVPLADASVGAYYAGQNAWIAGAGTDVGGHAVLACIRSDTVVDVRVSSQGFFWADVCGVRVGPGGRTSVEVIPKPNPDPRRRPIPPICGAPIGRP